MKKLWIIGIALIIVLMAGTYIVAGHMIGDDIVNLLALAGAGSIVVISVFVVLKYVKQMQEDTATGELLEDDWDGVREYNNDLPFGWAVSMVGLMVWGMWYMLSGYPLGSYSQVGEYNEDVAVATAKAAVSFEKMTDTQKLKMGQGVFSVQCAPCHGLQGKGQENYATGELTAENLTERKMSKTYVEKIIREGSTQIGYDGGMPPLMLSDDAEIATVSEYISNGFKDEDGSTAGKDLFASACSSCHGAALPKGIQGYKSYGDKPDSDTTGVEGYSDNCLGEDCLGQGSAGVAPSLKGYNSCLVNNLLRHGMKKGEIGTMPAYGDMLSLPQIEALSAYVAHGTDKEIEE